MREGGCGVLQIFDTADLVLQAVFAFDNGAFIRAKCLLLPL